MPPQIMSSPFMNLTVIDKMLVSPCPPQQRVQLLSAKLHLLTHQPSDAASGSNASSSRPPIGRPDAAVGQPAVSSTNEGGDTSRGALVSKPPTVLVDAFRARQPELQTRLDLARAHLEMRPPGYTEAEAELSAVDRICKAADKKLKTGLKAAPSTEEPVSTVADATLTQAVEDIQMFRRQALELLVVVEQGLGRDARAARWTDLLQGLR